MAMLNRPNLSLMSLSPPGPTRGLSLSDGTAPYLTMMNDNSHHHHHHHSHYPALSSSSSSSTMIPDFTMTDGHYMPQLTPSGGMMSSHSSLLAMLPSPSPNILHPYESEFANSHHHSHYQPNGASGMFDSNTPSMQHSMQSASMIDDIHHHTNTSHSSSGNSNVIITVKQELANSTGGNAISTPSSIAMTPASSAASAATNNHVPAPTSSNSQHKRTSSTSSIVSKKRSNDTDTSSKRKKKGKKSKQSSSSSSSSSSSDSDHDSDNHNSSRSKKPKKSHSSSGNHSDRKAKVRDKLSELKQLLDIPTNTGNSSSPRKHHKDKLRLSLLLPIVVDKVRELKDRNHFLDKQRVDVEATSSQLMESMRNHYEGQLSMMQTKLNGYTTFSSSILSLSSYPILYYLPCCYLDGDGRLIDVNAAFANNFGFNHRSECLNRFVSELFVQQHHIHPNSVNSGGGEENGEFHLNLQSLINGTKRRWEGERDCQRFSGNNQGNSGGGNSDRLRMRVIMTAIVKPNEPHLQGNANIDSISNIHSNSASPGKTLFVLCIFAPCSDQSPSLSLLQSQSLMVSHHNQQSHSQYSVGTRTPTSHSHHSHASQHLSPSPPLINRPASSTSVITAIHPQSSLNVNPKLPLMPQLQHYLQKQITELKQLQQHQNKLLVLQHQNATNNGNDPIQQRAMHAEYQQRLKLLQEQQASLEVQMEQLKAVIATLPLPEQQALLHAVGALTGGGSSCANNPVTPTPMMTGNNSNNSVTINNSGGRANNRRTSSASATSMPMMSDLSLLLQSQASNNNNANANSHNSINFNTTMSLNGGGNGSIQPMLPSAASLSLNQSFPTQFPFGQTMNFVKQASSAAAALANTSNSTAYAMNLARQSQSADAHSLSLQQQMALYQHQQQQQQQQQQQKLTQSNMNTNANNQSFAPNSVANSSVSRRSMGVSTPNHPLLPSSALLAASGSSTSSFSNGSNISSAPAPSDSSSSDLQMLQAQKQQAERLKRQQQQQQQMTSQGSSTGNAYSGGHDPQHDSQSHSHSTNPPQQQQ